MRSFFWGTLLAVGVALPFACTTGNANKPDDGSDEGTGGTPDSVLCEEACILAYPGAEPAYRAFRTCLTCGACFNICSANVKNLCEEGVEGGCSVSYLTDPQNPDPNGCNLCVNSTCAAEQLPDTTFNGVCKVEAESCSGQPDCVSLNNCIVKCIKNGGPSTGGSGGMAAQGGAGA